MKINFLIIFTLFGMLSSCDSKTENKDLLEDKDLIMDMHTLSNYQDLLMVQSFRRMINEHHLLN